MVGVGVSIPLDYMTDEIEDVPKDTKNDLENRGYFPRSFVGTVMAINPYGKKQALVEGEAQIDSYSRKVNVGDTLGATVSAAYKGITKPVFRVAGLLGGGRSYAPGRFIENINEKGLVRIVDFVAATPGELQKVIFVPTEGMKDPHWYHHIPILGYILPRDVTYKNISKVDGKKDIDVVLSDGSASGWVNAAVVAKTLAPLALMGVGGGSGSSSAGNNNADSTQNSDENKETPVIPPVIPPVQDGGRDERTGGDDVTSR